MKKPSRKQGLFLLSAFVSIVFLLVLSSCTLFQKSYEEIAWQEEVLWAQECGLEGMICCADKEPECDEGFKCCVSPINKNENMCRDECTCGLPDNYCCAGVNLCQDGSVCKDNVCRICGDENQPCCGEDVCEGDLACHQGTCVLCGEPGNPCCEDEVKCIGQDSIEKDRAECVNNLCNKCGSAGSIACPSEPICNTYNLFNNGLCLSCGNANEPCCKLVVASTTESYCQNEKLNCQAGFCVKN